MGYLRKLKGVVLFLVCEVSIMEVEYEIKDEKLKKLVEKKAEEWHMAVDEVIWGYINRGLFNDSISEKEFRHTHSKEFLDEMNEALGLDDYDEGNC